jgi:hypothetical protein
MGPDRLDRIPATHGLIRHPHNITNERAAPSETWGLRLAQAGAQNAKLSQGRHCRQIRAFGLLWVGRPLRQSAPTPEGLSGMSLRMLC